MENNQEKEVLTPEVEIVETSIVPVKQQQSGVAMLFTPEKKEKLIQAFIQTEVSNYTTSPETCKKLVKESKKLTIKDKNDKEGFEKLQKKYREFVKVRTSTEKERKFIVEPYLKIKEGIDDVGKNDILGILKPEEERMKSQLDQWKKWEEEEAERIEAEAKKILDERIKELQEVGLKFDGNFYSIGETISVDIVTIKDFSDEVFAEFKKRVSDENDKIVEAERIQKLHNERRELALPFIAYWDEYEKTLNFGEVSESDFNNFLERIKKAKEDFEETQRKQAEEAEKQANERKNLNFEKRSFKLEKEGFEVKEDGSVYFSTEAGSVSFQKNVLETLSEEDWEERFKKAIEAKKEFQQQTEGLAQKRKDDAEKQANEQAEASVKQAEEDKYNGRIDALIKLGLKFDGDKTYIFHDINFDVLVDVKMKNDKEWNEALIGATKRKAELDKEIADKEEAERVQKLPEIQKAERYIEEVLKIQIPQINGSEIAEVLADFKNKIKIASDEALSNLKNL